MEQLGLQPLPSPAPFHMRLGNGKVARYGGKGRDWPEVYFHDTIWETKWKDKPYMTAKDRPFTRATGWNALDRPLTLEEAKKYARQYDQSEWSKIK